MKLIDLHVHSSASDGSFPPAEVVRLAKDHCLHPEQTCYGNVPFMEGLTISGLARYRAGLEVSVLIGGIAAKPGSRRAGGFFDGFDVLAFGQARDIVRQACSGQ